MSFTFQGIVLSDLNDSSQQSKQAFEGRIAFSEINISANNLLGVHRNQKQRESDSQPVSQPKKKVKSELFTHPVLWLWFGSVYSFSYLLHKFWKLVWKDYFRSNPGTSVTFHFPLYSVTLGKRSHFLSSCFSEGRLRAVVGLPK